MSIIGVIVFVSCVGAHAVNRKPGGIQVVFKNQKILYDSGTCKCNRKCYLCDT